jgi:hypothetical protein
LVMKFREHAPWSLPTPFQVRSATVQHRRHGRVNMREKSGIDVALFVTPARPTPDVTVCPTAGVATAATNLTNRRKFRCLCTANPPFQWSSMSEIIKGLRWI